MFTRDIDSFLVMSLAGFGIRVILHWFHTKS